MLVVLTDNNSTKCKLHQLAAIVLSNPSTRHIWAGLITHVLTQSGLDLVIFMLCVKCNCSKNLYKSHNI